MYLIQKVKKTKLSDFFKNQDDVQNNILIFNIFVVLLNFTHLDPLYFCSAKNMINYLNVICNLILSYK